MAATTPGLSGARKAAIALVAMGDEATTAILRHFQEDEIAKIVREIATLGNVSTEQNDTVLGELRQLALSGASVTSGGVEHAKRLLAKAVSPDQSRRLMDTALAGLESHGKFDVLEKADPQQLAKFMVTEHPQTIALVVAHLNTQNAATLLGQLPEELRADVLMRVASLQDIPPDVISNISAVIEQKLKGLGGDKREHKGGMRAVAELFNRMSKASSRTTLERIEATSPEMAVGIRNMMFVFDDLIHIEAAGIREMINRADKKALTIALKGASDPLRQHFLGNMSKRAADLLKEEMETLGTIKMREIEKAQQEIVSVARQLEEEGVISTDDGADEAYVA